MQAADKNKSFKCKYLMRAKVAVDNAIHTTFFAVLLGMLGCSSVGNATGETKTAQELRAMDSAKIAQTSIAAPLGRFLLVKRGKEDCAVRFTSYHRDGDYTYADYDWYYQPDSSGDFSRVSVVSGRGQVRDTPSIGIGKFSFKPLANSHINCGSLELFWGYPTAIRFSRYAQGDWRQDDALMLAPTKLTEIREVNLNDARLKWYQVSGERPSLTFIPLAALPY